MSRSRGSDHEFVTVSAGRRGNASAVLNALWPMDVATADDVIAATGLARASVHDLCEQLIRAGWVREVLADRTSRGAGRPARRYALAEDAGLLVGIEAGVAQIRVSVADLKGTVLGEHEARTHGMSDPHRRTTLIEQTLDAALGQAGADAGSVLCIVAGVPAPVTRDGHNGFRGNPFWEAMNPELVDRLAAPGRTVLVDNVVNLVATAEAARGQAQGVRDFIVLEMDEGFGAGVVVDGQLLRGAHGGVGEMRYLDHVTGVGAPTGVSALAVQLTRAALDDELRPSILRGKEFDARTVFAAAKEGDQLATEVVADIGRRLTTVVATLVTLLDPSLVVLTGHIANSCDGPREAVELGLPRYVQPPFPQVVLSTLGDSAVTTGALDRALEHVQQNALDIAPRRPAGRPTDRRLVQM